VKSWLDAWVARRKTSEGALVTLTKSLEGQKAQVAGLVGEPYFKSLARRGRLDYLPMAAPRAIHGEVDRLRDDQTPMGIAVPYPNGKMDRHLHSLGWGIDE
jgi:hypothetical protein